MNGISGSKVVPWAALFIPQLALKGANEVANGYPDACIYVSSQLSTTTLLP